MNLIKKITSLPYLIVCIMFLSISCSEDNPFEPPMGNQNNGDTGPMHLYEISFSGGNIDGESFSGRFPDNMIVAYRHQNPDGNGGEIDTITLTFAEESQANDFSLGMLIRMDGDSPRPLDILDTNNESQMVIAYDNYILTATTGTITMTNLGQTTYQGITYPHFTINYTAEMNGATSSNPNAFTTQVTGSITVRRLDVN